MTAQSGPIRPLPALRGAFTFLTRIPVPGGEPSDWHAFRRSPWTFPVVGAVIGGLAGLAFLAPSAWGAATGYLFVVYLISGVTHADGLSDLGDAIAAHDPDRRLEALTDSELGVGGALALALSLIATTLGVVALATGFAGGDLLVSTLAFRLALAAEIGAKSGMALLACLGRPAHEGLGSAVVGDVGPWSALPVVVVAVPAVIAPPTGAFPALIATVLSGPIVALAVYSRVRPWLGGVSGDVLGASNELGRAVALHVGVLVWAIL